MRLGWKLKESSYMEWSMYGVSLAPMEECQTELSLARRSSRKVSGGYLPLSGLSAEYLKRNCTGTGKLFRLPSPVGNVQVSCRMRKGPLAVRIEAKPCTSIARMASPTAYGIYQLTSNERALVR